MNIGSGVVNAAWGLELHGRECCPECGDKMAEVDRRNENSAIFVWYECNRDDCGGQWLERVNRRYL